MASAMRVFRKFQSSDGRIKAVTASGVLGLVAVIALLIGVLPAIATSPGPTGAGVEPVPVEWGGGSGACDDVLISSVDGVTARGPSAAEHEFHWNNPAPGTYVFTGPDPDGTQITITVDENDAFFEFSIEPGMVTYDVVVNGGKKSNHYEYDGGPGIVPSDSHLSAPTKDNKPDELHNLSHINLCYDTATVTFVCDGDPEGAFRYGDGTFAGVKAQIFNNSVLANCEEKKSGLFFIDNGDDPNTKLDFGAGGSPVAGRLDVTKVFVDEIGDPDPSSFEPLEYSQTLTGERVDLSWCEVRDEAAGDLDEDGNHPFDDFLPDGKYPSLIGVTDTFSNSTTADANACKVYEEEDASGVQFTVVYFEFEDPHFY